MTLDLSNYIKPMGQEEVSYGSRHVPGVKVPTGLVNEVAVELEAQEHAHSVQGVMVGL